MKPETLEFIVMIIPISISLIQQIILAGKRIGKIETKLDILYDDVRALEKYN